MKKFIVPVLLFAAVLSSAAAPHLSNQNHSGSVTAAAASGSACFTAGSDGFVIRWNDKGDGEQYQMSDLPIKMIAVHPNGDDIALYETDGFSVHRISVWSWRTQTRRYAKRFADTITALVYTKKGTYLVAGTASVNGAVFLQSSNGNQVRKISEQTGIVSMIASSDTEASCVMYSLSGHISYYDLNSGQRRARFSCEANLAQAALFGNNLFLAGFRDGAIFVIDAMTGKTVAKIQSKNPLLASSEKELFFIEQAGKNGTVKMIAPRGNSAASALVVKNFTLSEQAAFTSCALAGGRFVFGASSGNVYTATAQGETAAALSRITRSVYQKILDIAVLRENIFCFLTADEVFTADYANSAKKTLAANGERHTNMTAAENGAIILWSKNTRRAVTLLEPVSYNAKKIYTPKNNVTLVRAFGSNLVIIEGNSTVSLYPLNLAGAQTAKQLYLGTGIQDALLDSASGLYIAKSAASNPLSPLIFVDTATRETVRLPLSGDVSYAMIASSARDAGQEAYVYGISLSDGNSFLFAYNAAARTAQTLITYASDDVDAFTYVYDSVLYTNIGKANIIALNTLTGAQTQLERGFSLSVKIARNADFIVALAKDGGIIWYRANAQTAAGSAQRLLSQWYLKLDNTWEFTNAAQNAPALNVVPAELSAPGEPFDSQDAAEPSAL
jgi:WD40 repeat protein